MKKTCAAIACIILMSESFVNQCQTDKELIQTKDIMCNQTQTCQFCESVQCTSCVDIKCYGMFCYTIN